MDMASSEVSSNTYTMLRGEGLGRRGSRGPDEGLGRRGSRGPDEGLGRRGSRGPDEGRGRRGSRDPGGGRQRRAAVWRKELESLMRTCRTIWQS